ncbi:MAG: hypothetical protein ABI651_11940, partial [Verrucomicrobiota bacterium]
MDNIGYCVMELRFHAVKFSCFFPGKLARARRLNSSVSRGQGCLPGSGVTGALASRRYQRALLFLQIIIVVADAVDNFPVALEGQDAGANAVQKIAVVAYHQHHAG